MKKILFLLLLTVVFGACETDSDLNWNNRPGGTDETQNWDSYTITVDDWQLVGNPNEDNSFYRCYYDDEYLNQFIFDKGSVMVYIYLQEPDGTITQSPLPYVTHHVEGNNSWTETISYDFAVGSLGFYITYSDFITATPPKPCKFRVVMHW